MVSADYWPAGASENAGRQISRCHWPNRSPILLTASVVCVASWANYRIDNSRLTEPSSAAACATTRTREWALSANPPRVAAHSPVGRTRRRVAIISFMSGESSLHNSPYETIASAL